MATRSDIELLLYNWLDAVTDAPVIKANQSGPQPTETYVTYQIITGFQRYGAYDERIMPSPTALSEMMIMKGYRQFTVSIQAFGLGANDIINSILEATQKPTNSAYFKQKQEGTITITAAVDSTLYTVYVDGEDSHYTSGVGNSIEVIRDGLLAALQTNTKLPTNITFDESSTDTITILAKDSYLITVNSEDNISYSKTGEHIDMAIITDSGIRELTQFLETSFEERANIDISFVIYVKLYDNAVGSIDTVNYTQTIDTITGEITDTGSVTI